MKGWGHSYRSISGILVQSKSVISMMFMDCVWKDMERFHHILPIKMTHRNSKDNNLSEMALEKRDI